MHKEYYGYHVYDDGRIYSTVSQKWLKPSIERGYAKCTLSVNKVAEKWSVHRLVATLFIPNPDSLPQVNHIDGNKLNNHYSNLEWCTAYHNNKHARDTKLTDVSKSNRERWNDDDWRKRTSESISKGQLNNGCHSWKNNGRWRYQIVYCGHEISRKELSKILGIAQSTTDRLIFNVANGKKAVPGLSIVDVKGQSTIERVG